MTERRGKIQITHSIEERPLEAQNRSRLGDWEGDTVIGKKGYVKFEVETGASPGWSPMVIYKGALVNIWLKG